MLLSGVVDVSRGCQRTRAAPQSGPGCAAGLPGQCVTATPVLPSCAGHNLPMTQWLLPILTAALGYVVHWAQQALAWRHEHRAEQRAHVFSMREKLVTLRELTDIEDHTSTRPVARRLASDAGLLRDEALRERVSRDVRLIGRAWTRQRRKRASDESLWVNTFVDDAYECLSAMLRDDGLPEESEQTLLFLFEESSAGREAMVKWMMGPERASDSEWQAAFERWRAEYQKGRRRSSGMRGS